MTSNYQIVRPLGEGAGGEIFLAQGPTGPVALKFLKADIVERSLHSFRDEVQLLSHLSHPNLIKIFDFHEGNPKAEAPWTRPCFSMEYLEGDSFDTLPQDLPFEAIRDLFLQTCGGLRYLHQRRIFHRDLKPSNLWRCASGAVKILDFGLALHGADGETNAKLGTLAFTPPEAYWGHYDGRSDLFSLGATFYRILSGDLPYSKPLFPELLAAIPDAPPLRESRPDLPEYFCELLRRLLSREPSARPGSASSVLKYLAIHGAALDADAKTDGDDVDDKPPLVGRDREISEWNDLLAKVEKQPSLATVTGPTGIGRSRMLEEMRWVALLRGIPCVSTSEENSQNWRSHLRKSLGLGEGPRSSDPLEDIEQCLSTAGGAPRIWIFENLHLWEKTALAQVLLLLSLAHERGHGPTFLLEWKDGDSAAEKLESSLEYWEAQRWRCSLREINPAMTLTLLRSASTDAEISQADLESITRNSGGNPELALMILREFLSGSASPNSNAPHNFQEMAGQKIAALSESERELFAVLLAAKREADLPLISKVSKTSDGWTDVLLKLQQRDLLSPTSLDRPWLALRQPALASSYWEKLELSRKNRAHRLWLDFLRAELASRNGPPAPLAEILHHALAIADRETLESHGVEALRQLESRGEMQGLLDSLQTLARHPEIKIDPTWFFALQATACFQLGRFSEALTAYQNWFQAKADDGTGLIQVRYHLYLGTVRYGAGERDLAEQELQVSLQSGDPKKHPQLAPYQSRARNLLAAIAEKRGDFGAARDHLLAAKDLSGGDPRSEGEIEQRLGSLSQAQCRYSEARRHYASTLQCYRNTGNAQAEAIALDLTAMLSLETGALEEAVAGMETSAATARRGGDILQYARYLANRGLAELESGRFSAALTSFRQAEGLLRACGTPEDLAVLQLFWVNFEAIAGLWNSAESRLQSLANAQALAKSETLARAALQAGAELAYRRRNWPEARRRLSRIFRDPHTHLKARMDGGCLLAKTEARAGNFGALPDLLKEIRALPIPERSSDMETALAYFHFMADSDKNTEKLEAILASVQGVKNPVQRGDYWLILAEFFAYRRLKHLSEKFFRAFTKEWRDIRREMPEELRMDYDKNQGLESLEKALDKIAQTEAKAVEAAPPAGISSERFKYFCEINRQLLEKEDLHEILEQVMDASILLSGAERGLLILKEDQEPTENPDHFSVKTARRIHRQALDQKDFQFSLSVVREACRMGTPVLTNNASADSRFQEMQSVMQQQLKSILVVPLETGAGVSGAVYLDHRYAPNAFKPEDVELLSALAGQAALAIQKAKILEEVRAAKLQLEGLVQEQHHRIEALSEELSHSRDHLKFDYPEIVGKSAAMIKVFQLLDNVTQTKIPVWIYGESGTGKELIARSLHFNSGRKGKPFVTQNCSAIPENLLESELFGYKRGAFTHADRDRQGLFEASDGGTLFLDEVADMSLAMQAKLLRVLQEGEVRPLGSNKSVKIDVRLVTASNRDLRRMVKEEKFRQDLFFRINGMTIPLPPLRQRKQDIPLLVHFLVKKISKEFELKPSPFAQEAMRFLTEQPWPGNIRELESVVRNALLTAGGATVTKKMLQIEEASADWGNPYSDAVTNPQPLEDPSESELTPADREERKRLTELLIKHQLDKKKVATEMGLSLKTVYNAMERLGIPTKKRQLTMLLKS
ncbi:MAG: sigma 54-interacting transcriptional regulator [Deltaproteobacteria bacterium]|nr:sigma 54-interacting transcriptional regulator [Deltaproteobacteria bacterium]